MKNGYSDNRMIAEALDRVERGSPLSVDGLTMTPLLDGRAGEARYQTLQEAIAGGGFAVEEVSESGQVSELRVRNKGSQPVFLLDGEEVLGAKQNRVVNLSIMVPPQSATVIPVACVERGRWSRVSDEFRSSPNSLPSRDRAAKMRDVSGAMRRGAPPRTDQARVWSDLEQRAQRLGVNSATDAMDEIFAKRHDQLQRFATKYTPVEHQVGAIFALHGRECGIELFDASSTWAHFVPRLVRSWAVDAIDEEMTEMASSSSEVKVLDVLRTGAWASSPSLGLGSDVRLSTTEVTGASLVVGGEVVHLAAFVGLGRKSDHTPRRRSLWV